MNPRELTSQQDDEGPPRDAFWQWYSVPGVELADAVDNRQHLEEYLLDCQAVYLWRRNFRPMQALADNGQWALSWIEKLLSIPLGEITNKRLAHFANLGHLTIGGSGLTPEKHDTLKRWLRTRGWPRRLQRFIQHTSCFTPPLYVGETGNLRARVREHVRGQSGFGLKISKAPLLGWEDLDLHYCALAPAQDEDASSRSAKARRTLLELMIANLALCGYADRPG